MIAYAKIEDVISHRVCIGTGSNTLFYTSIGMKKMDVEKSEVDGNWYEAGFAPIKSEEVRQKEESEARLANLLQYLDSTDWYAARFAETGAAIPDDVREKRAAARVEIDELRAVLATL